MLFCIQGGHDSIELALLFVEHILKVDNVISLLLKLNVVVVGGA